MGIASVSFLLKRRVCVHGLFAIVWELRDVTLDTPADCDPRFLSSAQQQVSRRRHIKKKQRMKSGVHCCEALEPFARQKQKKNNKCAQGQVIGFRTAASARAARPTFLSFLHRVMGLGLQGVGEWAHDS